MMTELMEVRLALDTVDSELKDAQVIIHPFAIVLTQDCDLTQDWRQRQSLPVDEGKLLPSVLFAQVHQALHLRARIEGSEMWKRVKQNKDERYHFLEAVPDQEDALGEGLPELGIDFKRYFTIPTDEVYKRIEKDTRRRCRLRSPYLEHLSTRFCYYQFRVALPEDHRSA
jgi:hypothetical protein